MTHHNDIWSALEDIESVPNREGTVTTSVSCSRFYANHYAIRIETIAHATGVRVEVKIRKSFLSAALLLSIEGKASNIGTFLRNLHRLEK